MHTLCFHSVVHHPSIHLNVHPLFTHPAVHPQIWPSINIPNCPSTHLTIHLSINLLKYPSSYAHTWPSGLSVCSFSHPCTHSLNHSSISHLQALSSVHTLSCPPTSTVHPCIWLSFSLSDQPASHPSVCSSISQPASKQTLGMWQLPAETRLFQCSMPSQSTHCWVGRIDKWIPPCGLSYGTLRC